MRSSRPAPPPSWRPLPLTRAREPRRPPPRHRSQRETVRAISSQVQRLAATATRVLVAAPHRCGSQAAILAAASRMRFVAGTSTGSPMELQVFAAMSAIPASGPPQIQECVLTAARYPAAEQVRAAQELRCWHSLVAQLAVAGVAAAGDVLTKLKVSYMSRDNAQKWPIIGGQNPSAQWKRPRSSRACMHVVF